MRKRRGKVCERDCGSLIVDVALVGLTDGSLMTTKLEELGYNTGAGMMSFSKQVVTDLYWPRLVYTVKTLL